MGEDRYIGGAAERLGVALDAERDKSRLDEIYLETIRGRLEPLSGAVEFVNACKQQGWRVVVASGADRIKVVANLREIGLPEGLFETVVDGNQVVRKKPAPDIFLEACRRIGLPPSSCLVVEDAVSGVAAAKAAGARCLGITTTFDAEQLAAADWIAPDLACAGLGTRVVTASRTSRGRVINRPVQSLSHRAISLRVPSRQACARDPSQWEGRRI